VYEKTGKLEYVQHFLGHADLKRRWNGTIICSEKRRRSTWPILLYR
jgi:hypothetical protein